MEAERLQQMRKMEALSQLAAGVAEEGDDLLNTLYGQIVVIGGHRADSRELARCVQEAFDGAIESEHIIKRLREFAGRHELTPVTISPAELLARQSQSLRQVLGP